MSEQAEQREHQATEKRLSELRERGDTLRSKDLSGGLALCITILSLTFMSNLFYDQFRLNFTGTFTNISYIVKNEVILTNLFKHQAVNNLLLIVPLFIVLYATALGSMFIFGGWNFSLQSIKFNWSKLNPGSNLSMIFSSRLFIDLGKSLAKLAIILVCFYVFIVSNKTMLMTISYYKFNDIPGIFFTLLEHFIVIIMMGILFIMGMDAAISYHSYQSKTKMSTQELKDEFKESEGNMDIKRKLRSLQYALAKQKIPQMIPKATVVVTNPTHYAVALQYNEMNDHAPKVIAKGKGNVAAYIRRLAVQHAIPIYEEPPLARALFHTTKNGAFINPALYMAVAIVLTYINQVRRYQNGLGPLPERKTDLSIPAEFIFKE